MLDLELLNKDATALIVFVPHLPRRTHTLTMQIMLSFKADYALKLTNKPFVNYAT